MSPKGNHLSPVNDNVLYHSQEHGAEAEGGFYIMGPYATSLSMGRLTLNMLLPFAQFEREITVKRIRDKVAASKKRGIWMGGAVPFGHHRGMCRIRSRPLPTGEPYPPSPPRLHPARKKATERAT
jgi:hypothetical protein